MIKCLFVILSLFSANVAFAASGEGCKNLLTTQLSSKLQSSNINTRSQTLERDVRALLLPQLTEIIEHNKECTSVKDELRENYSGTEFSVHVADHRFDIVLDFTGTLVGTLDSQPIPDEMESVLPWFGILVVQKGSLDNFANADVPIISSEYMKKNKDKFFPANSKKLMGIARACTHGNHMAHDKDVVNRAAHTAMNEEDSFWRGNDYYIYDGEDVYWGWAQIAGEVALALVTLGLSAEIQAAAASVQAANIAVQGASKGVAAAKLTKNSAAIAKAAAAAKNAKAGSTAAAVASRADAAKALADAGITVKKGIRATELVKIGNALETAATGIKSVKWASSLGHPWRLVTPGIQSLKPKNIAKMYGPGVTWGQRIKRGAITAAGTGLGIELIKAFGYSTASYKLDDNLKFNGFGLLSADDLEGRENEVSHGAWLKFEEVLAINDSDALDEALAFAEDFAEHVQTINNADHLCDGLDIYVVQPAVSNPQKMGTREVFYIIQNPAGSLRIE